MLSISEINEIIAFRKRTQFGVQQNKLRGVRCCFDVFTTVSGQFFSLFVGGGVLWHISYSDQTLRHSLPQERIFFFWSYGTSLFKLDLEAFFASGKSFYRTQNDSNQVAFEFQNLFETSKHRQQFQRKDLGLPKTFSLKRLRGQKI